MNKHVIVVGAGVIGAVIAYYLSKAGAQVTVLEKNHIAAEASGGSFGWLNANSPESPDYFALRNASLKEFPNLLNHLAVDVEAQQSGCLFWEMQGEALIENYQALQQLDYAVELIDSNSFSKLEPHMENIPPKAIYARDEGAVDGEKLTRALLLKSKARVIEHCEITSLQLSNKRVTGVATNQGDFSADNVVLAAGTAIPSLLAQVGIKLPMRNRKGLIVTTKPTENIMNRVLFGDDIHFKQHADGAIVIGDWLQTFDGDVDLHQTAQQTLDRFSTYFPNQSLEIDKVTCAYRPMPKDGYSAVGTLGHTAGLYIASTHSGITLAPIIGKLATQEILFQSQSGLLKSFRPDRFNS